jgi:uncharacterized protein YbjT (DUF2867 family)
MTRVLVTGATGNVGSHVVRELCASGVPVRAFVRDPRRAETVLGDDVEVVTGDFSDTASVRRALTGVDAVLLSCSNQPEQGELEIGVIDAAADAGVGRLVKLSTPGAQVGSPVAFFDAHGRVERRVADTALPAVILHSNFYMSNLFGAAESVRRTGKLFAPLDGARIAMIDPRDVAAVAAVALAAPDHRYDGRTLHLSGPEVLTYAGVAVELSVATGRDVEFINVDDSAALQSMLASGMTSWLARNVVALFGALRAGVSEPTSDTVREVIGRPARRLGHFLRDHADVFRS